MNRVVVAVRGSIITGSVLPDDEWFAEVALIVIKMLTGKANFGDQDRDMAIQMASVSARSILSAVSHGSH
ncbi:hypothetical protein MLD38_021786 [Melastoma candidum]|uniref:Uncharacterized protein n=1 Tax=Melastoma candidum TaxID=119954 RepID=A0ACB9QHE1_9MYRT|nr:hypothetical protein MLD38_021786 [Melastoma candidum]